MVMAKLILLILVLLHTIGPANMKKHSFFIISALLLYLGTFSLAVASTLYIALPEASVGESQEYKLDISIDAAQAVNIIEASLIIPHSLDLGSVNNSNSIVSFWIDKPIFNDSTGRLTFAGMIPGGFSGNKGHILSLTFKITSQENDPHIIFDGASTHVYLNDGNGTKDTLDFETVKLPSRENIHDTVPPEAFIPIVTHDSTLHEGKWVVLFQTQDKGSGISHYEVQESKKSSPQEALWKEGESPYILLDQKLQSYIFVKAVDEEGNQYIAHVAPTYPSIHSKLLIPLLILVCITFLLLLFRKVYYRYRS